MECLLFFIDFRLKAWSEKLKYSLNGKKLNTKRSFILKLINNDNKNRSKSRERLQFMA